MSNHTKLFLDCDLNQKDVSTITIKKPVCEIGPLLHVVQTCFNYNDKFFSEECEASCKENFVHSELGLSNFKVKCMPFGRTTDFICVKIDVCMPPKIVGEYSDSISIDCDDEIKDYCIVTAGEGDKLFFEKSQSRQFNVP
ncbi:hypothetical protein MHBO_004912, partial [Bonamia ostreae]